MWYGGGAGDGLRSGGEEALPSSKSVCSILPIAHHWRAGVPRTLGHLTRPAVWRIIPDDMDIPLLDQQALSGRPDADIHDAVNFAQTAF